MSKVHAPSTDARCVQFLLLHLAKVVKLCKIEVHPREKLQNSVNFYMI